jgi:hypothetical protein
MLHLDKLLPFLQASSLKGKNTPAYNDGTLMMISRFKAIGPQAFVRVTKERTVLCSTSLLLLFTQKLSCQWLMTLISSLISGIVS